MLVLLNAGPELVVGPANVVVPEPDSPKELLATEDGGERAGSNVNPARDVPFVGTVHDRDVAAGVRLHDSAHGVVSLPP